jgi:hypothetical protein
MLKLCGIKGQYSRLVECVDKVLQLSIGYKEFKYKADMEIRELSTFPAAYYYYYFIIYINLKLIREGVVNEVYL